MPVGVVDLLGVFLEPEPEGHGDIEDSSGVPVGKVAVLHRGIYRIYGHFQLLRRLADSSVFDNDETADDFLIFPSTTGFHHTRLAVRFRKNVLFLVIECQNIKSMFNLRSLS